MDVCRLYFTRAPTTATSIRRLLALIGFTVVVRFTDYNYYYYYFIVVVVNSRRGVSGVVVSALVRSRNPTSRSLYDEQIFVERLTPTTIKATRYHIVQLVSRRNRSFAVHLTRSLLLSIPLLLQRFRSFCLNLLKGFFFVHQVH